MAEETHRRCGGMSDGAYHALQAELIRATASLSESQILEIADLLHAVIRSRKSARLAAHAADLDALV